MICIDIYTVYLLYMYICIELLGIFYCVSIQIQHNEKVMKDILWWPAKRVSGGKTDEKFTDGDSSVTYDPAARLEKGSTGYRQRAAVRVPGSKPTDVRSRSVGIQMRKMTHRPPDLTPSP